jgi:hypothetical protein
MRHRVRPSAVAASAALVAAGLAGCGPRVATDLPELQQLGVELYPDWCDRCPAGERAAHADGSPAQLVLGVPHARLSPALQPGSQAKDAMTLLGAPLARDNARIVYAGSVAGTTDRLVIVLDGERIGRLEWTWAPP